MVRAIIMSAGDGVRWKQDRGIKTWSSKTPKQLIEIGGERLLDRTIRLLRERGVKDISVTYKPFKFDVNVDLIKNDWEYEIERFYPVEGEVLYLYGDVFYTDEAMDTIIYSKGNFFGRKGKSKVGGKRHSEMFAVKGDGEVIQKHVQRVIELYKSGKIKRCIGWDLYKSFYNQTFDREGINKREAKHLVKINDLTDDFDRKSDLINWLKSYEKR